MGTCNVIVAVGVLSNTMQIVFPFPVKRLLILLLFVNYNAVIMIYPVIMIYLLFVHIVIAFLNFSSNCFSSGSRKLF